MIKLNSKVTDEINFYKNTDPVALVKEFGSPLYVYNESILRERANEMKNLVDYKNFKINYSAKANSNLAVLQIIHDVGVDAEQVPIVHEVTSVCEDKLKIRFSSLVTPVTLVAKLHDGIMGFVIAGSMTS